MLQILNSTERNQAFLKFLLFFLITVSLIVWAVYFNVNMPRKENVILKSEVNATRQQESNQMLFLDEVEKTDVLIDSLGKPLTNYTQVELLIDEKVNRLSELRKSDNSTDAKLNQYLINYLALVKKMKKDARSLSADAGRVDELEQKLAQCQRDLDNARAKLPDVE